MKGKMHPEGWYESECCWNCEAEDLEKCTCGADR